VPYGQITAITKLLLLFTVSLKSKGEIHSISCPEGPDGKQRYSSTLSLTSALDAGERVILYLLIIKKLF